MNRRLPTLGFELWSEKDRIRHSYYEKEMRNQVLTEKRSSQSENQKFAILTNELNRRLQMMDENITEKEQVEKINHFTQQLINSGYQWGQTRDIIVSSLKGFMKKEMRRKESGEIRYRKAEETLEERIRRKLTENVQWYKEDGKKREEDCNETADDQVNNRDDNRWKPWRKRKKRIIKERKEKKENTRQIEKESNREKIEDETEVVRGVFFVPHTENSELAKRIRDKLKAFEEISCIRVKLVERTGEKITEILHKSNPWEAVNCGRDDCAFCKSSNEKLIGKCKKRNVVYETECLICLGEMGVADFPAVFFHISHWYLSWNTNLTNPSHMSQLSRAIN